LVAAEGDELPMQTSANQPQALLTILKEILGRACKVPRMSQHDWLKKA